MGQFSKRYYFFPAVNEHDNATRVPTVEVQGSSCSCLTNETTLFRAESCRRMFGGLACHNFYSTYYQATSLRECPPSHGPSGWDNVIIRVEVSQKRRFGRYTQG